MSRDAMGTFWANVDTSEGLLACWPWLAARRRKGRDRPPVDGYGEFMVDGKMLSAHRAAYLFTVGPIPDGMLVCHRCDNTLCCNPLHLFLGTARDNSRDMVAKGRGRGQFTPATARRGYAA